MMAMRSGIGVFLVFWEVNGLDPTATASGYWSDQVASLSVDFLHVEDGGQDLESGEPDDDLMADKFLNEFFHIASS